MAIQYVHDWELSTMGEDFIHPQAFKSFKDEWDRRYGSIERFLADQAAKYLIESASKVIVESDKYTKYLKGAGSTPQPVD